MATKTASKTQATKTQYTYGEFARAQYFDRFRAVDNWVTNSRESLDAKARDFKAQIVLDMKADKLTEKQIADELMITKQEVAKLVIRGTANSFGLDGVQAVNLVNESGNGITKVAIENIIKQGLKDKAKKSEIAEQLQELGLPAKDQATRKPSNAGGSTKQTRTAKALKALDRIQSDAFAGKLDVTAILDKLQDMEAELSLKA